jgi:tripartite-type tricarboxylate transporter receptor subunit TctC
MQRTILIARAFLLAALATAAGGSLAQQYPDRPLRLMAPFAASGGADIVARIVAERLGRQLGPRVLLENKPGAGGTIAADFDEPGHLIWHTIRLRGGRR